MLKQTACIAYGQSLFPIHRLLARPAIYHRTSIERYTCLGSQRSATKIYIRPLSTQSNGAKDAQATAAPTSIGGKDSVSESRDERDTQVDGSEYSSKPRFAITPRFSWRWRWHYPESKRNKKIARQSKAQKEKIASLRKDAQLREQSSEHFLPTRSEQEQNKLQSVMQSLNKLSVDLQPPPSPLETALKDKEWKPKRQPTKEERRRLAYNPWAMMLAGRLRFDAGSRVRLPEPLLVPLGQVTKPGGDSVYLLPDDSANLEAYDERLRKGLRRVAMMDLPRPNGGTTVNVSPYKPLIDGLTDEMVVWDDKLKSGRTKNGLVAKRLLPNTWMERYQRLKAYQNASKDYWDLKEKLGETDEQNFRKPETPNDVTQIQWQPNVAERMKSIMRQRLLLSLNHLGRKVDEPRSRPRRHVMCFNWPESLSIDVIAESTKYPISDDESFNYSLAAQHYKPDEQMPTTPEGAVIPTWTPTLTAAHLLDPDTWLPGSCFLHIGPVETALGALSQSQQPTMSPADRNASQFPPDKFIPPMLQVNNNVRLPIFNIQALLGPKFDDPLYQVLQRHGMGCPISANTDDPHNENYLILIRATAPGYHFVVRELWQLWRYLGGTDCLKPASIEISQGQPPRTDVQKQKERIKEYSMSKKVWDHLYTFLPGVERMSSKQDGVEVRDKEVKS